MGVESIRTPELVPIAPSTYYDHINREPSRRELRDGELRSQPSTPPIHGVYGAAKWLTLNREGIEVARCTVEWLMTKLGLSGTTRGKSPQDHDRRSGHSPSRRSRPAPLRPPAPNRLWVADSSPMCRPGAGSAHMWPWSPTPTLAGSGLAGRFHDGHLHGSDAVDKPSGPANKKAYST